MTIDDAQMQGCATCGHFIPDHVPGEGDCMYPNPSGCIAENGWPYWTNERVPEFALNFIRDKQVALADAREHAERLWQCLDVADFYIAKARNVSKSTPHTSSIRNRDLPALLETLGIEVPHGS